MINSYYVWKKQLHNNNMEHAEAFILRAHIDWYWYIMENSHGYRGVLIAFMSYNDVVDFGTDANFTPVQLHSYSTECAWLVQLQGFWHIHARRTGLSCSCSCQQHEALEEGYFLLHAKWNASVERGDQSR